MTVSHFYDALSALAVVSQKIGFFLMRRDPILLLGLHRRLREPLCIINSDFDMENGSEQKR